MSCSKTDKVFKQNVRVWRVLKWKAEQFNIEMTVIFTSLWPLDKIKTTDDYVHHIQCTQEQTIQKNFSLILVSLATECIYLKNITVLKFNFKKS